MIEGPGQHPLHLIELTSASKRRCATKAPFYTLGPLVTDIAPGYDHISSAIGAAMIGWYGGDMLCYVTCRSTSGSQRRRGARGRDCLQDRGPPADVARGRPGARDRDDALSRGRGRFDWNEQFRSPWTPSGPARSTMSRCRRYFRAPSSARCVGPKFCSMHITREIERKFGSETGYGEGGRAGGQITSL